MDLSQFKEIFIEEANSLLVSLDNTMIELEKDSGNKNFINEAFRVMHTIKGAAGMYGFDYIVEITHEIESLYDTVRQNKSSVFQSLIDLTFAAADHIRELLKDEAFETPENITRQRDLLDIIAKIKQEQGINAELVTVKHDDNETPKIVTWNILFYPNDDIIRRAINLTYTFHDLLSLGEYKISNSPFATHNEPFWSIFLVTEQPYNEIEGALLFVMDYCKISKIADFNIFDPNQFENRDYSLNTEEQNAIIPNTEVIISEKKENEEQKLTLNPLNTIATDQSAEKQSATRISVDANKLDYLMYLVSELVTTKSELILSLERQNMLKANDAAEKIEKLSKLFSENALSIRLVSLQEMLSRFKRLIRDLSKHLNKQVDFVISGEDTELDKNIIDNIGEPIMHLIRNCIDHGIENPEKRINKGKEAKGRINFTAYKSGNNVFITISDDGNGIDLKYVHNKAVENGYVSPDAILSDKEITDLIFLPGFSTAQSLTDISGRGVGMDIVKRKIQDIRGEVSVTSEEGKGTTFTLKLQQSVSIIETLLIEAEGLTYALPLQDIDTCILEPSENMMNKNNHQIGYNGQLIPYLSLRETFGSNKIKNSQTEKVVIINRGDRSYGIVADKIIGEYQAVIKPVGDAFSDLKFLSGASLLGDGSIALLLDTDKLYNEIST